MDEQKVLDATIVLTPLLRFRIQRDLDTSILIFENFPLSLQSKSTPTDTRPRVPSGKVDAIPSGQ